MNRSDESKELDLDKIRGVGARQDSPRRRFLQSTIAGTVLGIVANLGVNLFSPEDALAQSTLSPDAALQELMAGNQRFTSGRMTSNEHDLAILKEKTIDKQEPFAGVLSCADSRVPVELLFDQTIGHIFVPGSQATSSPRKLSPAWNTERQSWARK